MNMQHDPREILREEFHTRRTRNPRYSLRALSYSIGLSPGCVSEILSGKRRLTPYLIKQFLDRMNLPEDRKIEFLRRIEAQNAGLSERQKIEQLVRLLGIPSQSFPLEKVEPAKAVVEELSQRLAKILSDTP